MKERERERKGDKEKEHVHTIYIPKDFSNDNGAFPFLYFIILLILHGPLSLAFNYRVSDKVGPDGKYGADIECSPIEQ